MNSLSQAFRTQARLYPSNPAVVGEDIRLEYAELDRQSDRLAAYLASRGIVKGDRVGLYCPNSAHFVVAYLGILKAGAVVVPINLLYSPGEIVYMLQDAGARVLIHHAELAAAAAPIKASADCLEFSVGLDGDVPEAVGWAEVMACEADPPEIEYVPAEDLAVLLYTSGTTGRPKGAMLTHGNLLANTHSVRVSMQWRPGEDVVLVVLPMFHAFAATVGMLTTLLCGCALTPLTRFEPELVARTIHAVRATIFLGVPSMFTLLLRLKPERVPLLESLRFCVSGGAALPVEILKRFEATFGKRIYEGDGPTECSPVTCVNPVGGLSKPGTVGLPVQGVEMRIVGETGTESLPCGEVGEIAVRGPNVMKGYWNRPEDTAEVFRDGWFLTGDLGAEDEDGYFSILDRKKDLVIVNGMNVYPRVIEEVLHRFPQIKEAAVVGEPHDLHGEIPVAYVALDPPDSVSEADIREHCRAHLGRHEIPRKIHILPQLPRNASGKILKRELRKQGEVERGVKDLD